MTTQPCSVDGKVALITGAASGIGAHCARLLAEMGAQVMLTDLDSQQGQRTADRLASEGLAVAFEQQDVAEPQRWKEVVEATLEHFGHLDILVNNAGIYIGGTLLSNSLEQVRNLNRVNVESVFLGMQACAEVMKPGGRSGQGGSIINLSSVCRSGRRTGAQCLRCHQGSGAAIQQACCGRVRSARLRHSG